MKLKIDNKINGALGEFYFKHYCDQHWHAYIGLEDIYNSLTPKRILEFKKGFSRIRVKIPTEIMGELMKVCQPTNRSRESPSFVFDFLTCSMRGENNYRRAIRKDPSDFAWVEIKTGNGDLTINQKKMKKRIKIRFCIFRIANVNDKPKDINVDWEKDIPYRGPS